MVNGVSVVSSSTAAIEHSGNIVTVMFTLSLASFTLVYIIMNISHSLNCWFQTEMLPSRPGISLLGLVVTSLGTSTKLLYVEPG